MNDTWDQLTQSQLERIFLIPTHLSTNPQNMFWGKGHKASIAQPVHLIAYLPEDKTYGRLFMIRIEKEDRFYSDQINPLTSPVTGISSYIYLRKKSFEDTIAVFEEIQSQLIVDESGNFFSVYDYFDPQAVMMSSIRDAFLWFFTPHYVDNPFKTLEDKPSLFDTHVHRYYLSSYEKTVLKRNTIGLFHFSRKKAQPVDINIQIGHVSSSVDISQYRLLHGSVRHGMYVNASVLGVMIELLKEQVPSLRG